MKNQIFLPARHQGHWECIIWNHSEIKKELLALALELGGCIPSEQSMNMAYEDLVQS